ncbi:uncharacterized protein FTOL_07037 [Fusarium torulosum]|uniref:Uncharacterized protein n=1 Tax=Fusarium torulosum TaxID=33205 RepID=A0AAE8MAJ5_9HYPO|nr:uncharacterized protein FTOL_07037 [Fusarium torulosum]
MTWSSPDYDWIMETPGIENGELRAINSFTDQITLIEAVGDRMPSAIQISAAYNISMESCTFRELGAGGIGVGKGNNAHFTSIGLGANNIHISDNYFKQVTGNSITVGDEASRNITWFNNLGFTFGKYYAPNDWIPEQHTGWNTVINNWGKLGVEGNEVLDGFPNFSGGCNNTFLRNYLAPHVNGTSLVAQGAAFRAGIIPPKRVARPFTNCPNIADSYLYVQVSDGRVFVNRTNFDDVDFTNVASRISGPGVIFKE